MSIPIRPLWRVAALFSAVGLPVIGWSSPLSFQAALEQAETHAPSLAAQKARLDAARSAAIPAGELPDPKLLLGIENFPISGMDRGSLSRDFMTMQKIGLMQEVPNSNKRKARVEIAQATVSRTEAERHIEVLKVRRETALAWLNRYYLERKIALFDELKRENKLLSDTVHAQLASGKASPSDTVMPKQEIALLAERQDEVDRDSLQATAALRRWIGPQGDQPLSGSPIIYPIDASVLKHRLHVHPEIAVFESMQSMAQGEVKEAEAAKHSDWGVEVAYQHRGPAFGDMASVQFSMDLPLFSAHRQDPRIAAKQSELARIDAERESTLREHTQMLESDLAEYERLSKAIERQTTVFLPLAQEKVTLQLASYRAGKADLLSLLKARREHIDARLKEIDLESQRAQMAAKLHFSYGENPL